MSYFANAGALIVQVIFGLLLGVFVLRVLLQWTRANFYNPICQALYKATNPVMMPLQKAVPSWRNVNLAGVVLCWLIAIGWVCALLAVLGQPPGLLSAPVLGLSKLVDFTLMLFFWVILFRAILSFVSADFDNPVVPLLYKLSDPLLAPFQGKVSIGGMDLSPLLVSVLLYLGRILVAAPLWDFGLKL